MLRGLRLQHGYGGIGALQRAVLLNCGLEHDLRERRRDRLEHQAVDDASGKQADEALLIARAADADHDECGLNFAHPVRQEPERLLVRNLVGEEDAAAAAGCELDCFVERVGRGDRMICGGCVVNGVGERRIFGQNRDRDFRGRIDGDLFDLLRPPAYSRDSEIAGPSDVMQVPHAHCATLGALRVRRNWPEGRAALRLSRDLLDDHCRSIALRDVDAERAGGKTDADDEAGERQANGALDRAAILSGWRTWRSPRCSTVATLCGHSIFVLQRACQLRVRAKCRISRENIGGPYGGWTCPVASAVRPECPSGHTWTTDSPSFR